MKPKDFVEQLRKMMEMHMELIKSNSNLLQINLDLMKENEELKKNGRTKPRTKEMSKMSI